MVGKALVEAVGSSMPRERANNVLVASRTIHTDGARAPSDARSSEGNIKKINKVAIIVGFPRPSRRDDDALQVCVSWAMHVL